MKKSEIFKNELELITSKHLHDFISYCLENTPDYFFSMPASTTGKYHPSYSLGEGGLIRHTQAAVKIANELLRNDLYSKLRTAQNEIIAALIMHDSIKKGINGSAYTTIDHPLQASNFIKKMASDIKYGDDKQINLICSMIESHMGQWNTDRNGNEILPLPKTLEQKFVHLCDYLASREFITVEFGED